MSNKKVVYVDFHSRRKPHRGGFGGTPKQLFCVFLGIVGAELLLVAMLQPTAISSGFFAPTVIAVAVAGTLAVQRLLARFQVAYLHKRAQEAHAPDDDEDDHSGRTLH